MRRIWEHDEVLWGGPGPEIGNRLGWLDIADRRLEDIDDLVAFAEQAKDDGFTHAALLGMGGSSLGPEVIRRSYGDARERPRAARAGLHRPRRRARPGGRHRPGEHAVRGLLEVRRHGGDAVPHEALLRARRAQRRPVRGRDRPRQRARGHRRRARLPARVRERPGHRRALLGACPTSAWCRPRWPAWTWPTCAARRPRRPSSAATRPTPTRAWPSGSCWGRWRCRDATRPRSWSARGSPPSACGSSS